MISWQALNDQQCLQRRFKAPFVNRELDALREKFQSNRRQKLSHRVEFAAPVDLC